jgi:hypothetical protein
MEQNLTEFMLTLASQGDEDAIEWVIEHVLESDSDDSNTRPCQCGSGEEWVNCSSNSTECG